MGHDLPITFSHGGRDYSLVVKAAGADAADCVVSSKNGVELFRIRYTIAPELKAKWKLDDAAAAKFIARFAKYHAQARAARGDAAGSDQYHFDADFAALKPEALVEKVEKEWQALTA